MNILQKVKRLKELSAKATKGPWRIHGSSEYVIENEDRKVVGSLGGHPNLVNDGQIITESRNAIDELCLAIEEMSEVLSFYSTDPISRSEMKRWEHMDRGAKARAVLEKWVGNEREDKV